MKSSAIHQNPVLLALLPLAVTGLGFRDALLAGGLVCLGWLFTLLFFAGPAAWLPPPLLKTTAVFWLAGLGQMASDLLGVPPFWVLSVGWLLFGQWSKIVLSSYPLLQGAKEAFGFWAAALFVGLVGEFFSGYGGIHFFRQPAGFFLIMVLAALLIRVLTGRNRHA